MRALEALGTGGDIHSVLCGSLQLARHTLRREFSYVTLLLQVMNSLTCLCGPQHKHSLYY